MFSIVGRGVTCSWHIAFSAVRGEPTPIFMDIQFRPFLYLFDQPLVKKNTTTRRKHDLGLDFLLESGLSCFWRANKLIWLCKISVRTPWMHMSWIRISARSRLIPSGFACNDKMGASLKVNRHELDCVAKQPRLRLPWLRPWTASQHPWEMGGQYH